MKRTKPDEMTLRSRIAELESSGTRKFRTAKRLVALSESDPKQLYPHFDAFARLLETENNIIKWTAFQIVARLAVVARKDRIEGLLDRYLAPINGPAMVTAAHAIHGSALIARTHRHLANRIVRAILRVEQAEYRTDECRNVAIGHAITALGTLDDEVRGNGIVTAFVERHLVNTRAGTRRKAASFLRKAKATSRKTAKESG